MIKTLTRRGDRLFLEIEIDPQMLKSLGIDEGTMLSITTMGESLVVSPTNHPERRKKFESAKRDTFEKYDDMLRRLAQ